MSPNVPGRGQDLWRTRRRAPCDKERPMTDTIERARARVYTDLRAWYRRVVPTLAPEAVAAGAVDELVILMDPTGGHVRLVARNATRAQMLAEGGDALSPEARAALADVLAAGLNQLSQAAAETVATVLQAGTAQLVALWFVESETLVGALVAEDTAPVRLFTLGPTEH